ncbi:MAG: M48 family peptidase, partial [Campylobacter hyointestinalis]
MLFFLIGIYIIYTIYKIYLSFLQINFVKQAAKKPAVILEQVGYEKAANVAIINEKFSIISNLYSCVLLILWSVFGASFLQNLIV